MPHSSIAPDAYRLLMQMAPDPMLIADYDSAALLEANYAAQRLFGYSAEEFWELNGRSLHPEDVWPAIDEINRKLAVDGKAFSPAIAVRTKSGERRLCELSLSVETLNERRFLICAFRDVTWQVDEQERVLRSSVERLNKAQEKLAESEQRYRVILQSANDAILVSDFDTATFVEVNQGAVDLFGYTREEFAELTGRRLHPPNAKEEVDSISRQIIAKGAAFHDATRMQRRDETVFYASVQISSFHDPAGRRAYVTIIRDVSERVQHEQALEESNHVLRATQAQLVHASKMAAMGTLGAGIAHELNQPLTIIGGFARRIRRKPTKTVADMDRELEIITREVDRMAGIVDNVRIFGRDDQLRLEPINPMKPMHDATQLIEAQLRSHGIDLRRRETPMAEMVLGDSGRLQQVLLNLLTNARDAVNDYPEAEKWIAVSVYRQGDDIVYRVEDGGPGVPDEILGQLFDPFFTTKDPDKGTGLGLSIAYSIAQEHNGTLGYLTDVGRGCFELRVPVYHAETAMAAEGH